MYQPIKIAIIGRPNVGKSSLFNRLCKKRIAICHEQEGVTRDRLYGETEFFGTPLTLIDTGGIRSNSSEAVQKEITQQAMIAAEEADVLVLVIDGRAGVTLFDEQVAKRIRKLNKKIILAVNKMDNQRHEEHLEDLHTLGIEKIICISAMQNRGIDELLEEAVEGIELKEEIPQEKKEIRIAILGRSNVGKSTLLNQIFQENRSIVSDSLATTRDPIDASIQKDDTLYTFVDTAGIRRKKSQKNPVEKFADIRTQEVLKRADLCLFLIDSVRGLTTEEKKIAASIEESGKGCILIFNKWDLVKGFRQEHCLRALHMMAPFLKHIPTYFLSAKCDRDFTKIFREIDGVYKRICSRISTGELNRFIAKAMGKTPPPMIKGKRFKIYYMTQISINPIRFVFFINRLDLFSPTYKKYLINQFRLEYPYSGVPLQFKCKVHAQKDPTK